MNSNIYIGDCRDVLKTLPDASVDSIVTDPPYELGFMGKAWDASGVANDVETWRQCLRVLKPGGHLLAFGGTRTYHRMVCAVEDAGFEIRDQIGWVYGSGFPKSLNVAKAIESGGGRPEDIRRMQMGGDYEPSGRGRVNYDHGAGSAMDAGAANWRPATSAARQWQGWGTALKPAWEPICVARKPLIGTVAENVLQHGTGALNIDGCRVPTDENLNGGRYSDNKQGDDGNSYGRGINERSANDYTQPAGRWPANLIHDGSDEVVACFPTAPGQQGDLKETGRPRPSSGRFGDMAAPHAHPARIESDKSAARFFYCAKASKSDRGEGNTHPTVKPTELMRYLCRMVTPPGGVVLDPFMGSGSTIKAAQLEGLQVIGIELHLPYIEIARCRINDCSDLFA